MTRIRYSCRETTEQPPRRPPVSTLLLATFLLAVGPVPAAFGGGHQGALIAQSPPGASEGTLSLSFGIDGSGSGEAGVWRFMSDRTALGLLGTLDWVSEDRQSPRSDRSEFTLGVGPRLKWYIAGPARVAPFWFGGVDFRHTRRSEDGEDDRTSRGLGLDGGFGIDWFPVDQMSVGGWTGLRLSSSRAENDDRTTRLRTFTTGLRVHLYF